MGKIKKTVANIRAQEVYELLSEGKRTSEIYEIISAKYGTSNRQIDVYISEAKIIQKEVFDKYTEEYICKKMEELLAEQVKNKNLKEARLLLESINKIKNGTKTTTDLNINYKADFD